MASRVGVAWVLGQTLANDVTGLHKWSEPLVKGNAGSDMVARINHNFILLMAKNFFYTRTDNCEDYNKAAAGR